MHYDVAVIGAGPAGSTAALLLARRGYTVALLDRAAFPRDKVCGDYLTPGAVKILRDDLGVLPSLMTRGARRVTSQRIFTHNGALFGGNVDALACRRIITDAVLIEAAQSAGVDVRQGFSVRDICFDSGRVAGVHGVDRHGEPLSIRASITIGADGTHSLLARRLGAVREIPRLHRIALSAYFNGDGTDLAMYLPTDRSPACCGFGAATGERDLRNVNIVVPPSESKAIASGREQYFRERLRRSFPDAWKRIEHCRMAGSIRSTACFGHRTVRAAFDGAVLVGDAATFIHPFTGEGVYFALEGARLAARAIDDALTNGDTDYALSRYERDRKRILSPRYRLCDLVQHVVHTPPLLDWFAARLSRSSKLTDAILGTVGDIEPVQKMLCPSNFGLLLSS